MVGRTSWFAAYYYYDCVFVLGVVEHGAPAATTTNKDQIEQSNMTTLHSWERAQSNGSLNHDIPCKAERRSIPRLSLKSDLHAETIKIVAENNNLKQKILNMETQFQLQFDQMNEQLRQFEKLQQQNKYTNLPNGVLTVDDIKVSASRR